MPAHQKPRVKHKAFELAAELYAIQYEQGPDGVYRALTLQDIAARVGVNRHTVGEWTRDGNFQALVRKHARSEALSGSVSVIKKAKQEALKGSSQHARTVLEVAGLLGPNAVLTQEPTDDEIKEIVIRFKG